MINKIIRDLEPARIAVVFDAPGKTFRDDLYSEYKANRPPLPDDIRDQIEPSLSAIEGLGIKVVRIAGVEADGRYRHARQSVEQSGSADDHLDGRQGHDAGWVDDQVVVLNSMDNRRLDTDGVAEKFGVEPRLIVDYLSLIGDSSDNIPGCPASVRRRPSNGSMRTAISTALSPTPGTSRGR